jgi:hypothetical protein
MPNFLVESYLPRSATALEEASAQAGRAAELARGGGASFQHVRTTLVGADETCFHMFVADSIEAVEAALARVGLRADRIVQAVESKAHNLEGGMT